VHVNIQYLADYMTRLFFVNVCSGSVTAPTLQFDVPKLEFGTVSYGKLVEPF